MTTEQQEFIQYAKDARRIFSDKIANSFHNKFTVDERVQIEDLLIAYDQLVWRLEDCSKVNN